MTRETKRLLLDIATPLLILLAFTVGGSDDYAEAKRQEQVTCAHQPTPEFCRHVE